MENQNNPLKKLSGRPKKQPGEAKSPYNRSRNPKNIKKIVEKQLKANTQRRRKLKRVEAAVKGKQVLTDDLVQIAPESLKQQLENNDVAFQPNPGPQTEFLASPESDVLYGGAAGGGKSYALLADLLRFAHISDHRALLLRRTLAELTELIQKSKEFYPKAFEGAVFKEAKSTWVFPSGATALFSYLDKDTDVSRYQGQSFTWIAIDEITHYPSAYVWDYLRSRLRTTNPEIKTYMRATANPGGPGHDWVKKTYIDPAPSNKPFWATDITTGKVLRYPLNHSEKADEPLFTRKFIPAKLTDNPYLLHSGEYEMMLLSLPEVERKRLLEGDWDIAEGAAFSEFTRYHHVVDPFEIPRGWYRVRAADYGFTSPSCVLWGALDHDDNLWIYRELYITRQNGDELGVRIRQMEDGDPAPIISVLDGACWNRTGSGLTIAELINKSGCRFIPADKNRVRGKLEIHKRLRVDPETGPKIRIFSNCLNIIRELTSLPLSKTNSEDVDTKASDHAYDALRYMCMTRQVESPSRLYNGWASQQQQPQPINTVFGY
jgi:hypothetical protein